VKAGFDSLDCLLSLWNRSTEHSEYVVMTSYIQVDQTSNLNYTVFYRDYAYVTLQREVSTSSTWDGGSIKSGTMMYSVVSTGVIKDNRYNEDTPGQD
jgi:hypothetical protein